MSEARVRIVITAEASQAQSALQETRASIERLAASGRGLSGTLGNLGGAFGAVTQALGGIRAGLGVLGHIAGVALTPLRMLGHFLGGVFQIATGIVAANVFMIIAGQIRALAGQAIEAAGAWQQYTIALETLAARELMRGQEVERAVQKRVSLTQREREELEETLGRRQRRLEQLELERRALELLDARVDESIKKNGLEALATQNLILTRDRKAQQIRNLERDIADMTQRIDELTSKEGALVNVTERVRVGMMGFSEAMALATPKAQELLARLRDLALVSPYTFPEITDAMRFSMAMGLASDMAFELTRAMVNAAAGMGLTNEQFYRLYYNLAQAVEAGDLTAMNLRQLRNVGLDLAEVFETELNMSIQEVSSALKSGKMTAEDVAKAFVAYSDKYFSGAAKRMAYTFTGLRSNFKDLFFFLSADLLGPAIGRVSRFLGDLFDTIRLSIERGDVRRFGEEIAQWLEGPLSRARDLFEAFKTGGLLGVFRELGIPPEIVQGVQDLVKGIGALAGGLVRVGENAGPLLDLIAKLGGFALSGIGTTLEAIGRALGYLASGDVSLEGLLAQFRELQDTSYDASEQVRHLPEDIAALPTAIEESKDKMNWWQEFWRIKVPGALRGLGEAIGPAFAPLGPQLDILWRKLKQLGGALWEFISPIRSFFAGIDWGGILEGILKLMAKLAEGIIKIVGGVVDVITGIVNLFDGIIRGDFVRFSQGVAKIVEGISGILLGLVDILVGVQKAGEKIFASLWEGMKSVWENDIKKWCMGLALPFTWEDFINAGKRIIESIWQGMKDAWQSVTDWWNQNVVGLFRRQERQSGSAGAPTNPWGGPASSPSRVAAPAYAAVTHNYTYAPNVTFYTHGQTSPADVRQVLRYEYRRMVRWRGQ